MFFLVFPSYSKASAKVFACILLRYSISASLTFWRLLLSDLDVDSLINLSVLKIAATIFRITSPPLPP